MYFGKKCARLFSMSLNGRILEWVDSWNYLGFVLVSGKRFGCCVKERTKKFFKCANAILRVDGRSDETVMLRLLESHCVPILTYGIEVLKIADTSYRNKLRVAYNSIFRRIFGYRTFESVRELQSMLERPTWEELVERRKEKFLLQRSSSDSSSPIHLV